MSEKYEDGNYLTEKGLALITKCLVAKTEIEFTHAAVGAGTIPEGLTPRDMTDLADWKVDGVISNICSPVSGEAQIDFQVFSQNVATGFLASEAAVWAKDPDEGEILYTYIVISNSPEWIRASDDPVQKLAEFTCISVVSTADVDTTVVNPEAIATLGAVNKRLSSFVELSESETPKENTRVHLFVLDKITNWFRANKADKSEDAHLLLDSGLTVEASAQPDSGGVIPLCIIPENSGE